MCLVSGSNWVGSGSTLLDPHLVVRVDGLGPTHVEIFRSDTGCNGSSKSEGSTRPTSMPSCLRRSGQCESKRGAADGSEARATAACPRGGARGGGMSGGGGASNGGGARDGSR
jgi:hypothetical protein